MSLDKKASKKLLVETSKRAVFNNRSNERFKFIKLLAAA